MNQNPHYYVPAIHFVRGVREMSFTASVELRTWFGDLVVCTVSMMEQLASHLKMVKVSAALKGQFKL